MHSFTAPARKPAVHRLAANGLVKARAHLARRVRVAPSGPVALCVLAFALMTAGVTTARAQEAGGGGGGTIMIAGPAETNPAAVVAMAKDAGMTVDASASQSANPAQPVNPQPVRAARPVGYAAAAHAADAAMRAAALALDAHADAADASSSSADTSGFIVIPGPGEANAAKPMAAAPRLAMTPSRTASASASAPNDAPDANGMIEIPGNGEPKAPTPISNVRSAIPAQAADPLPRVTTSSRDVMPVVVATDGSASAQGIPRVASRGFQARPIAAAPATPVAGMMPVSMRTPAPIRAPLQPAPAMAGAPSQLTQDGDSVRAAALVFLTQQAAGLPGKADITVTPVFPRGLAACSTLEPFLPAGSRVWGRTTVGVRCSGERPWTLYLQARVSVMATYYLAARAVAPGEVLTTADLIPREGDLTAMPQAIVTDPSQAVGAVTLSRLAAGLPLRTDMLRGAGAVVIGQSVRVVTAGAGFSISAEGSVMNNAAPGQQVRVKTAGGQIISGIVKDGSTVEIQL
ncbi:Chaperone for flagella basal body P-ring formation [Caballeronia sp. SBC1]|uniref:flagellar basal body P-ring formation chaperone FlgA n=1 Tax=Caballeronia sp. SBC1 TaxID=2705548 RepID=UPI00140730F3|nr:flagellar basal body P-ring formation chaperone FlgA [Caballeronia sp. SBC1]QIN63475.1 Chaperone for flagella basal body P-ring formation [Caballeronia sp. SBC1]